MNIKKIVIVNIHRLFFRLSSVQNITYRPHTDKKLISGNYFTNSHHTPTKFKSKTSLLKHLHLFNCLETAEFKELNYFNSIILNPLHQFKLIQKSKEFIKLVLGPSYLYCTAPLYKQLYKGGAVLGPGIKGKEHQHWPPSLPWADQGIKWQKLIFYYKKVYDNQFVIFN